MIYASRGFIKSMASVFNLFPKTDYREMYKKTYQESVEEDMRKTSQDLNAAIIYYARKYEPSVKHNAK